MGVAAYNRGSKAISEQIARGNAPFEEVPGAHAIRETFNSLPHGDTTLFMDTVARPLGKGYGLFNKKEGGYGSFCYPYRSLYSIRSKYAVTLGRYASDEHGPYWEILAGV